MESGPSKISETIVGWLIPPACREEVLGDMRERHQRSAPYLLDAAAHVIPFVIYSRICRTTDAVVALTEAVSMYTSFAMAAWWLDPAALIDERGFVRLAIPPAIFLAATILADAYSDPKRRRQLKRLLLKPLWGPMLGFALAYAVQSMLGQWALPASVLAWGSGMSLLLVSTLRLAFPPIADRPQAANAPSFWQKLEFAPLPLWLKGAMFPTAIVLAVILYLLKK
jgi:hypothetical protein